MVNSGFTAALFKPTHYPNASGPRVARRDLASVQRFALRRFLDFLGEARREAALAPIADFNPLLQMASGVYLTFFGSFVFGTPGFPLSDVPLQDIARDVAAGRIKAKPWRVFGFDEVREAHRVMEAGGAGGKMVVVHG